MPRSLTTEAWSLKKLTLRERRGTLCSFGGRGLVSVQRRGVIIVMPCLWHDEGERGR